MIPRAWKMKGHLKLIFCFLIFLGFSCGIVICESHLWCKWIVFLREQMYWRTPERSVWINAFAPLGKKTSVSTSITNWKWLFPLTLLFITKSHQKEHSYSKGNSHSICPCTVGRDLHAQQTEQGLLCCGPWNNFCPQTCKSALPGSGSLVSGKVSLKTWGSQFTPLVY